jgi:glycosyltransferase involved in cell wall biosynthesis
MTAKLLSIVVPVYNGADTIAELVEALARQSFGMAFEIILINDASKDSSQAVCERLVLTASVPITLITHSRNFGEHNTVMTGLRSAKGDYIVTMDDDLQNPPGEILKLLDKLRSEELDIVYGRFLTKQHATWRNLGSKSANMIAEWLTETPRGLYMSTFRCMDRFLVAKILDYSGPYPFIDGLVFQITDRIGSVEVVHLPNKTGRTNYNLKKLIKLWLTILINFSTRPLQLSISLGLVMAVLGGLGAIYVIIDYFLEKSVSSGWPSLVVLMLVFTGTQLIILGLMGEYIGRMFIHVGGRPQAIVRSIKSSLPTRDAAELKSANRIAATDDVDA